METDQHLKENTKLVVQVIEMEDLIQDQRDRIQQLQQQSYGDQVGAPNLVELVDQLQQDEDHSKQHHIELDNSDTTDNLKQKKNQEKTKKKEEPARLSISGLRYIGSLYAGGTGAHQGSSAVVATSSNVAARAERSLKC